MGRHKNLVNAERALLLVIDVQERFREHIDQFSQVAAKIAILVESAHILDLPVVVTEQYTKGLGVTVAEIAEKLAAKPAKTFEKMCFSASGAKGFDKHLEKLGRQQIIVCGIETHVCVNQSVHDLLKKGYDVHLVTDALGSRAPENKAIGLAKMYAAGALPTTVEMCLFEMLVESGTDKFKAVQKLVK